MKIFLSLLLCLTISCLAFARDGSYRLHYDGGSISGLKTGAGVRLYFGQDEIKLVHKGDTLTIPAASITEISYGQDVHRRVGAAIGLAVVSLGVGALMALTKSKNTTSESLGTTPATRAERPFGRISTIIGGS